jgi:hypothetical protein
MLPYNYIRHVPTICFGHGAVADDVIKNLELTEDEQKETLDGKGYIYFVTKTPPEVISVHILANSVDGILEGYRVLTSRMKQLYVGMMSMNLITIGAVIELIKTCKQLIPREEFLQLQNETFHWYCLNDGCFVKTRNMLENLLQSGTIASLVIEDSVPIQRQNSDDEYQKVDISLRAKNDIPEGSILGIFNMPQINLCTYSEWNRDVDSMSKCLKNCFHHISIQRSSETDNPDASEVEVVDFSMSLNPFLSMLSNARDFRQASDIGPNVGRRHFLRFKYSSGNALIIPSIHIVYETLTDIAAGQEILVDHGAAFLNAQTKHNKSALELMDFAARSSLNCSLLLRQSSGLQDHPLFRRLT